MASEATRVFIVAGEPSGDVIGSRLMASLLSLSSEPLEFGGVGGPLMEKQGLRSEFQMEDIAVMGVMELIPHTLRLWARLRETIAAAIKFQPNVVITVDAKGFSFRVLHGIRDGYALMGKRGPPTVHYLPPSFWAWKRGEKKLKDLAKIVDHMLCILPFEEAVCRAHGLEATFVGHPVLEDAHSVGADPMQNGGLPVDHSWCIQGDGSSFREQYGIHPGAKVLSVLPGSRLQEVKRMLPIFNGALHLLHDCVPNLTAVIPTVHNQYLVQTVESMVNKWKFPVILLPGASEMDKYNAFAASNAGLCMSGTVVMQLFMARVPSVVGYRAHPLTEWIIRARTKLSFISLPNVLLGSAIIPEALFAACTPRELVSYLLPLLEEESRERKNQLLFATQVMNMVAPPLQEPYFSSLTKSDVHGDNQECIPRPSMIAASTILRLLKNVDRLK